MPGLLRAMDERFSAEAPLADAATLRVVTYSLLGLRFRPALVDQLMPGLHAMRDSLTYQAIIAEGVAQGEQRLILRLGTTRFGPPDDRTRAWIESITDVDALTRIFDRVQTASSWSDLDDR
jgi:hypothetical protein